MKKPRVLLADDHRILAEGLKSLLEPEIEVVGIVEDGRALLVEAEILMPGLIVVDLPMRVSAEANVARGIKETFPETRFIVLSIHDEPAAVQECLEAGAAAFVLKRSAVDDLSPAVKAVQREETYLSPRVEV